MTAFVAALVAVAALALPTTALADPPPNDNRGAAQAVSAPSTTDGTTVEATGEEGEDIGSCESAPGSVWYRLTTERAGRVIAEVQAAGDLDAVVDVFRVRRSELTPVDCDATDRSGRAAVSFDVGRNQSYLIRVARQEDSVADTFRLTLQYGRPPATAPGPRLPAGGATGSLHRVRDPSVAYSVRLRAGVTYKFNLVSGSCTPLQLYGPSPDSFDETPVKSRGCGGYMVFTPGEGEGGLYSLLATASRARQATRFRLLAGVARGDDTGPGRFLRNYARVRGSLNSNGLDVVDLYRFDVTRKSELNLDIDSSQDFRVTLLTAGGKRLARTAGSITRRLRRGRYFAVVRAARRQSGSYRLTRVSRTITRTRMSVEGQRRARVSPGATASLTARILPGVPGPVKLVVERFDPLNGWQFFRTFRVRASGGGTATVGFRPPAVGRWRVRAEFRGTRGASPSRSGFAYFRVEGPLEE